jgi:hypothetical protein
MGASRVAVVRNRVSLFSRADSVYLANTEKILKYVVEKSHAAAYRPYTKKLGSR